MIPEVNYCYLCKIIEKNDFRRSANFFQCFHFQFFFRDSSKNTYIDSIPNDYGFPKIFLEGFSKISYRGSSWKLLSICPQTPSEILPRISPGSSPETFTKKFSSMIVKEISVREFFLMIHFQIMLFVFTLFSIVFMTFPQ